MSTSFFFRFFSCLILYILHLRKSLVHIYPVEVESSCWFWWFFRMKNWNKKKKKIRWDLLILAFFSNFHILKKFNFLLPCDLYYNDLDFLCVTAKVAHCSMIIASTVMLTCSNLSNFQFGWQLDSHTPWSWSFPKGSIKKVKLATAVEGNLKAPFLIATTLRRRKGCYSFPRITPLYSWSVPCVEC